MSAPAQNGPRWRNSPFGRQSPKESQSPSSSNVSSKSALFSSSPSTTPPVTSNHVRQQSFSPMPPASQIGRVDSLHRRSTSQRNNAPTTATFAPQFIKSDEIQNGHKIHGIEGENDFSGKHYVWLKDPEKAFVRGWVVQELPENRLLVQCDDGSVCKTLHLLETKADSCSNVMSTKMRRTRSIPQSSTRLTIWPN